MDQELRRSPWQRLGMGPEGENASRQAKGMLLWLPRCGVGSLLLSRQLVKECRWSIQSFRCTDSSQTHPMVGCDCEAWVLPGLLRNVIGKD